MKVGASVNKVQFVQAGEPFAEVAGCSDDEVLESVECFRSGAHGTYAGDTQHAQHFGLAVGGFRFTQVFAGEHHCRSTGGVLAVGFAVAGAALPVGPSALAYRDPDASQVSCQSGSVVTDSFDTDRVELAEAGRPGHETAISAGGGT